jgi:O-acetyl-ADP-ribose deacetylase (regulator of RNase III)
MIEVITDDLAFVEIGALARPVDAELRATTPLLRRLESAAGDALARQLQVHEPLAVGSAVVTGAGDLSAELLIHAVITSDDEAVSKESVRRALTSALQRALDFGVDELALPPFGLGAGNLDIEDCADVMLDVLHRHAQRHAQPARVIIVVEGALEQEIFSAYATRRAT